MPSEKSYDTGQRLDTYLNNATDWQQFGSLSAGWVKGNGSTSCTYRRLATGLVVVRMPNLTVSTTANNTTIVSSANGFTANFLPNEATYCTVRCDVAGSQTPAFRVDQTDGSIAIFGIGATATRVDAFFCFHVFDFALH